MYHKYIDMHQAVNIRKLSSTRKAKPLWKIKRSEGELRRTLRSGVNGKLKAASQCDKRCGRRICGARCQPLRTP